jgi:RNA polymerase sigma factor (sigma-70 family)
MKEADAVKQYLPFVVKMAKRFAGLGLASEDLIQEGLIAVAIASRTWDPTKGANMLTYIYNPVRRAMQKAVNKHRAGVVRRVDNPPSFLSVDLPSKVFKGETIISAMPAPEVEEKDNERLAKLPEAMSGLTQRTREIIRMRYVDGLTLAEIGKRLGISKQRVAQIEEAALLVMKRFVGRRIFDVS